MKKYVLLDLETGFYLGSDGKDALNIGDAITFETLTEAESRAELLADETLSAIRVDAVFISK